MIWAEPFVFTTKHEPGSSTRLVSPKSPGLKSLPENSTEGKARPPAAQGSRRDAQRSCKGPARSRDTQHVASPRVRALPTAPIKQLKHAKEGRAALACHLKASSESVEPSSVAARFRPGSVEAGSDGRSYNQNDDRKENGGTAEGREVPQPPPWPARTSCSQRSSFLERGLAVYGSRATFLHTSNHLETEVPSPPEVQGYTGTTGILDVARRLLRPRKMSVTLGRICPSVCNLPRQGCPEVII